MKNKTRIKAGTIMKNFHDMQMKPIQNMR